jgi:hypothetical protein
MTWALCWRPGWARPWLTGVEGVSFAGIQPVSPLDPHACVRVYPTGVETLRIGQLAGATGVGVRALRHYGRLGLLTPARADNPYRVFQPGDIERVRLIQLLLGGLQAQ